jgi:3-deoxy-D-manno-octulosonic acid (KDO) 8-phosphate synthase
MKQEIMRVRNVIAWTYFLVYLVGLGLALSQIDSVSATAAVAMVPSLIVGFFGVLIAFWVSFDEANIQEMREYLGPAIKEKADMLKQIMTEKEKPEQHEQSIIVKNVNPPQTPKTD